LPAGGFTFWGEGAAIISGGVFFTFLVALIISLMRGLDIDCGCFSTSGGGKISWLYILRDFSLLGISLFVFIEKFRRRASKSVS
jgi:hypothetical protein